MAMFGEEYLKNRHFLNIGNFLYLTGKVEERYNQPGVWEFRPKVIQLLNDVRSELSSELALTVDIAGLNQMVLARLDSIIKDHSGQCKLKVNLTDVEEGMKVELLSKKYMVDPSNDFFKSIRELEDVDVRLISKKIDIPVDTRPDFKKFAKA